MDILKDACNEFGIHFTNAMESKFNKYSELIRFWKTKTNVTNIINEKDIIVKHFVDSLSGCKVVNFKSQKVIDLGTGIGFPGLPLKIVFPEINICFVDSSKKKAEILKKICNELGINDYDIVHDEITNLSKNFRYREKFDVCLVRALSSTNVILEYAIPFLKVFGSPILYKGPNSNLEVENSLQILEKMSSRILKNAGINLPLTNIERKIYLVEKLWKTKRSLPRRVDKILKGE